MADNSVQPAAEAMEELFGREEPSWDVKDYAWDAARLHLAKSGG
jgi:hypothetical protein